MWFLPSAGGMKVMCVAGSLPLPGQLITAFCLMQDPLASGLISGIRGTIVGNHQGGGKPAWVPSSDAVFYSQIKKNTTDR